MSHHRADYAATINSALRRRREPSLPLAQPDEHAEPSCSCLDLTDALDSLVSDVRNASLMSDRGGDSRGSSTGSRGSSGGGYASTLGSLRECSSQQSYRYDSCQPDVQLLPTSSETHRSNTGGCANCSDVVNAVASLGVFQSAPCGQHLQLDILSTWGDPYYVGLSALELFDEMGVPVEIAEPRQISADPADINVLPEYGHDIRVISNLFDGTYRTCDDAHLWLAPFTPGRRNHVYIDIGQPVVLSMVRVWNYNKSRIHSFRGARMIEIRLDDVLIFRGEVGKAPGALHEVEKAAEPILFMTDDAVLQAIDEHDQALFEFEPVAELPSVSHDRPATAEHDLVGKLHGSGASVALRSTDGEVPEAVRSALERPRTAAFNAMLNELQQPVVAHRDGSASGLRASVCSTPEGQLSTAALRTASKKVGGGGLSNASSMSMLQDYMTSVHPTGRILTLVLISTWGDPHYTGLNGLQIRGPTGAFLRLVSSQISADPPSIASFPQHVNDPRTVDKLVDGTNASYDDRHMFLAPFTPGRSNIVRIDFGRPESIAALRMWNYSKTSTRGVRAFEVVLDGHLVYQGSMRPAPPRVGNALEAASDFVQTVLFTDNESLIREEASHVYTQEDLEDRLTIFDNGEKITGDTGTRVEDVLRPSTSVVGNAPPTARRGQRPVGPCAIGSGTISSTGFGNPRLHSTPQAAIAAAQARAQAQSAAALRRPAGSGGRC